MRNHERYYDPTAGMAIRQVSRKDGRRKRKGMRRIHTLTYTLEELQAFQDVVNMILE